MRGSINQRRLIAGLVGAWLWGGTLQAQIPQVGDVAPNFTLEEVGGEQVSLSGFRGRVVLVNFFGYD